jgi:hypothetical protein
MKLPLVLFATSVLDAASVLRHREALKNIGDDVTPSPLERFLKPVAQDVVAATTHKHEDETDKGSTALPSRNVGGKMLVTTAYWNIRSKQGDPKASDGVYRNCMHDVMTLNSPMCLYGDSSSLQEMQQARGVNANPVVESNELMLEQLNPCASRWQMLHDSEAKYTNANDVPSVELGCIWDGKLDLLQRSAEAHPEYLWHAWMDVCMGHGDIPFSHDAQPWPSKEMFLELPTDRITVSYSGQNACEQCRNGWGYCHCLAGTVFVVPGAMVEHAATNFSKKVNECLDAATLEDSHSGYVCLSDQVILTKLYLDNPDLFFISSSGYGAVATSYLSGGGSHSDMSTLM